MCRAAHLNKQQDRAESVFASSPQYSISRHSLQKYLQMQNSSFPRMKKKTLITKKRSFHPEKRKWPLEKYQSVERATYTLNSSSIVDQNLCFFEWF